MLMFSIQMMFVYKSFNEIFFIAWQILLDVVQGRKEIFDCLKESEFRNWNEISKFFNDEEGDG